MDEWFCKRSDIQQLFPSFSEHHWRLAKERRVPRPDAQQRIVMLDQDTAKAVLAEMFRIVGAYQLRRLRRASRRRGLQSS